MKNIRWRIGLSVFVTVGALHLALSYYVLQRVWKAELDAVDDDLMEELLELAELHEPAQLEQFARAETAQNTKWDEDFVEVREPGGRLLAASANVPAGGLAPGSVPRPLQARRRMPHLGGRVWESPHPHSRSGHTRIRVAELALPSGRRLLAAESLKRLQKNHWALREQLAWSLIGVALLVAAAAWWVARRALAPIQTISARARELGTAPSGLLPRSGRGDELDRLSEVLNELLARVRAEVLRVRRLSADAAHALRTPLTAIRGTLEVHLATRREGNLHELLPALEVLDDMSGLVNRLLLLERLESTAPDPERMHEVQLDSLAAEIAEALAVIAQERAIELSCHAQPVRVRGDTNQLRNALFNLLDNALRHTPEGGRVSLQVRIDAGRAQLIVEDSGPGLREDQLERVFERFYSEQGARGGSGLGLPIARAIAEAHGGALTASSPAGARFELLLPLAAPVAAGPRRGSK